MSGVKNVFNFEIFGTKEPLFTLWQQKQRLSFFQSPCAAMNIATFANKNKNKNTADYVTLLIDAR